jgi:hypothetical protein
MRLWTVVLSFAMTTVSSLTAAAWAAALEAGVARIDLTPPATLKAPLSGYGERMNRPAEGVHDRLFAKALVISDGAKRFVLITADTGGFPPPIKPAIVERLSQSGWTADQMMLLPSHTHAGISMSAINPNNVFGVPQIGIYDPKLFEHVVDALARVIQDAERQLVPVAVGTSSRQLAGWSRNRRHDGGPTDPELTVTRIDTVDGRPLAVLLNFTAHPTFMTAEHMFFSGGWPGHAQRTLEALIGDGVTAMYHNGAEGDQSPSARPDSGPSRWEMAERFGRELGIEAGNLWESIAPQRDAAFDYHAQTIELPDRTWHPDFMQTGGREYGLSEELLAKALPRLVPGRAKSVSLRLGELVIAGVPGEITAELGLVIKAEAARITGAAHPVIGGLADQWISYILSEEEYRQGGYEASVSFYGPTLGKTITAGVLEGVKRLTSSGETASR